MTQRRDLAVAFAIAIVALAGGAFLRAQAGVDVAMGPDVQLWAGTRLGVTLPGGDVVPMGYTALATALIGLAGNLGSAGLWVSAMAAAGVPALAYLAVRAWGGGMASGLAVAVVLGSSADGMIAGALFHPDALAVAGLMACVLVLGATTHRPWWQQGLALAAVGGCVLCVREVGAQLVAMLVGVVLSRRSALWGTLWFGVCLIAPGLLLLGAPFIPMGEGRAWMPLTELLHLASAGQPRFSTVLDAWWPLGDTAADAQIREAFRTVCREPEGCLQRAVALNARHAMAMAGDLYGVLAVGAAGWLVVGFRRERAGTAVAAMVATVSIAIVFWAQRRHAWLLQPVAWVGIVLALDGLRARWPRGQVLLLIVAAGIAVPQLRAGAAALHRISTMLDDGWPSGSTPIRTLAAGGRLIDTLAPADAAVLVSGAGQPGLLVPAMYANRESAFGCPHASLTVWTVWDPKQSAPGPWRILADTVPVLAVCEPL